MPARMVSQISGRVVNSLDDITVQEVPTDGTMALFPAADGKCIYSKRWTPGGNISTMRFVPEASEAQPKPPSQANTTQGAMNTDAIQQQIASCRCENEKQQMQTRFENQQNHCTTMQAIDKVGDRIVDYLTAQETQRLRDENQSLKFQASQVAQN